MAHDRGRAWRRLWESRGRLGRQRETSVLQHLLATDGCEAGLGRLTESAWRVWLERAVQLLDLQPQHRLLDCGCGAGPMLYGLEQRVALRVGVDYSEAMLRVAQEHLPTVPLVVGDSTPLPFRGGSFDRVLCSGVLMYFRDYDYARQAIKDMLRVCVDGGRVLIMDVPDLARREEMERQRAEPSDRKRLSSDPALTHLYYSREFFGEIATALGVGAEVFDQTVPGYGNAPYRFNVLLTR